MTLILGFILVFGAWALAAQRNWITIGCALLLGAAIFGFSLITAYLLGDVRTGIERGFAPERPEARPEVRKSLWEALRGRARALLKKGSKSSEGGSS